MRGEADSLKGDASEESADRLRRRAEGVLDDLRLFGGEKPFRDGLLSEETTRGGWLVFRSRAYSADGTALSLCAKMEESTGRLIEAWSEFAEEKNWRRAGPSRTGEDERKDLRLALELAKTEDIPKIVESMRMREKGYASPDDLTNLEEDASLLMDAARNHRQRRAEALMSIGADPNARGLKSSQSGAAEESGVTPLMAACTHRGGSPERARGTIGALLAHGADPKARSMGSHALMFAAGHDAWWAVKILADAGLSPDEPGRDGETALQRAARNGATRTARELLNAGADPRLRGEGGMTPLDTIRAEQARGYPVSTETLALLLSAEKAWEERDAFDETLREAPKKRRKI